MRCYFLALTIALAPRVPLRGSEPIQQRLQTNVENYTLSAPTFAGALAAVASEFKIPIGVELVANPPVLQPVKHTWKKATVMEILATLVSCEKGYRLQADDGIVHVFQKDLVNQRINFLNLRIKRFDVQNTIAPSAARNVWELVRPRFERPKPAPPGPHGTVSSMTTGGGDQAFTLQLHDATVRDILDRIALSSDYPVWVVAFAPGKALTATGFRRTASPTNGNVGELAWETLRWGEKPY